MLSNSSRGGGAVVYSACLACRGLGVRCRGRDKTQIVIKTFIAKRSTIYKCECHSSFKITVRCYTIIIPYRVTSAKLLAAGNNEYPPSILFDFDVDEIMLFFWGWV